MDKGVGAWGTLRSSPMPPRPPNPQYQALKFRDGRGEKENMLHFGRISLQAFDFSRKHLAKKWFPEWISRSKTISLQIGMDVANLKKKFLSCFITFCLLLHLWESTPDFPTQCDWSGLITSDLVQTTQTYWLPGVGVSTKKFPGWIVVGSTDLIPGPISGF